jgi:hypothetical protein
VDIGSQFSKTPFKRHQGAAFSKVSLTGKKKAENAFFLRNHQLIKKIPLGNESWLTPSKRHA